MSLLIHLSMNVIAQDGSHGRSAEAAARLPPCHSSGSVPAGDPECELHAQCAASAEPAAHGSAGVQGTESLPHQPLGGVCARACSVCQSLDSISFKVYPLVSSLGMILVGDLKS